MMASGARTNTPFRTCRRSGRDLGGFLPGLGVGLPAIDTLTGCAWGPFAAVGLLLHTLPKDQLRHVVDALHVYMEIGAQALRAQWSSAAGKD